MTMATKSITSGQQKQYIRFVEDAAERALKAAGLDKAGVQKLLASGGEFQAGMEPHILAAIRKFGLMSQYASEEVASTWGYPNEYRGPKPISTQVDILAGTFGLSLGLTSEFMEKALPKLMLPDGAEGWFAIPSVDALAARFFPEITDPAERYCRATELVIEKVGGMRRLENYRKGMLGTKYLRQHPRTIHILSQIAEQQKGDILILPAQFGLKHRGRSVRCAREVFQANEFGLGGLHVGSMNLTHPERFVRWEQLHAGCPGDEYDFGAKGEWAYSPFWSFSGGEFRFNTRWIGLPYGGYGSVSAFLPE